MLVLGHEAALLPAYEKAGIQVHRLHLQKRWSDAMVFSRLRKLFKAYPPDVVHGWMYHGNLIASLLPLIGYRGPVFWGIRQSVPDLQLEKRSTRWLIRLLGPLSRARQLKKIVYNSQESQKQHEALGYARDKSLWIPNGFEFAPPTASFPHAFSGNPLLKTIGCLARYHPVKDHSTLLEGFALFAKNHPDTRLVLAGTGMTEGNPTLMADINKWGIREKVVLMGPRNDVADWLPQLDVHVLSSAFGEAFPNAVGEAMAAGVPCIATQVGDCAAIIGDTGFLIPPRNPKALAQALAQFFALNESERQALGQCAQNRMRENYNLQVVAKRYWDALYEQVFDHSIHI